MNVVRDLQEEIEKLRAQIKEIQDQCSHPEAALTKTYGSNTGNYDPSADGYWIDYTCGLCGKKWTGDQ